jgi:hypothetical protein
MGEYSSEEPQHAGLWSLGEKGRCIKGGETKAWMYQIRRQKDTSTYDNPLKPQSSLKNSFSMPSLGISTGSVTPPGRVTGVTGVRVRVGFMAPQPYPYPQSG